MKKKIGNYTVDIGKPDNSKIFFTLCKEMGLPKPIQEYKFDPNRKWRIDWFFKGEYGVKVALEVEGGVFGNGKNGSGEGQGRHTRGKGFMKDMEKYNAMSEQGIILLRCVPSTLLNLSTLNTIKNTIDFWEERFRVAWLR